MTKDNWIKAFENTRLVKMGGMCFECCDYEDMVDDMKAFISQVEKDAIEKTNVKIGEIKATNGRRRRNNSIPTLR